MSIKHKISLIIQSSSSNCVQTSTSQFLEYYKIYETPDSIESKVHVRKNSQGKPMGTLFADIGKWLINEYGRKVTMHVFDTQIIDRSWHDLSQDKLFNEIKRINKNGVETAKTPYAEMLTDAYENFMEAGGIVNIVKCTNELLKSLLKDGPIMAIISFNYMYDYPRSEYNNKTSEYEANSVEGKVIEHAIVITGYENDYYFYNDPDYEKGGQHKVKDDIMIGAICTAQLNSDNYIMSIKP